MGQNVKKIKEKKNLVWMGGGGGKKILNKRIQLLFLVNKKLKII